MTTVQKRDGRIVDFSMDSLRRAINWAVEGLDANPLELECLMNLRIVDGISTVAIQDNLIQAAASLASPSAPDWRYVAGRLKMWAYKKQTMVDRGFGELYVQAVDHLTYSDELKNNYTQRELELAGSWIDFDRDKDYDLAGVTTLIKKYLLVDELPQEAYLTIALLIASVEKVGQRLKFARQIYDAISLRKISLATPILANLRIPNGNLSSCFIVGIQDSLESIFANVTNAARISKNGGGVGINLSKIRAKGSWVTGRENASKGVTAWIKIFNDTAVAVDQG